MASELPGIRDLIVERWAEGQGNMSEDEIAQFVEWEFGLSVADDSLLTEYCG